MTISILPSLKTQNVFFERETRLFSFKKYIFNVLDRFLDRQIKNLNDLLDKAYIDAQGMLVILKEYTKENAKKDVHSLRKTIKLINAYKFRLEKANYLDNENIKIKINLLVSALYEAELIMTKKAFTGESRTSTNPELISAISSSSKQAIESVLSN